MHDLKSGTLRDWREFSAVTSPPENTICTEFRTGSRDRFRKTNVSGLFTQRSNLRPQFACISSNSKCFGVGKNGNSKTVHTS